MRGPALAGRGSGARGRALLARGRDLAAHLRERAGHRRPSRRHLVALTVAWLLLALPLAALLFLTGSRDTVVAGHDATISPSVDGYATVDTGPYIPSFRLPTGGRLGADIDLGTTDLGSYEALIERYAFIASQPEGQIAKVRGTLVDLALDSAIMGALGGLLAPGLVLLVGRERWRQLAHPVTVRRVATAALAVVVVAGAVAVIRDEAEPPVDAGAWIPLREALPDLVIPAEAAGIEVREGLMTSGTRRLVESAIDTYRKSLVFYDSIVEAAPAALEGRLRTPAEGEVVGLLVSDRHDNVGMDPVARVVADAGGATFLMNAGDDTSTGSPWEAFSLESIAEAFADVEDRYAIAGNHDHGDFVVEHYRQLGFTTLDGEVVDGPDGIRLLGASDVRSSGLGSWRDERGISFDEQRQLLADLACEHDADGDRVNTLLVHDANSGREALARGCVDLVLGGHLHVQDGPTAVVGENGRTGWTYTTGTTGGAAFALAIGSKLRREAQVTLVTYRDGRPAGLQPVSVRTTGDLVVGDYVELPLDDPGQGDADEAADGTGEQADEDSDGDSDGDAGADRRERTGDPAE